jgi:dTDP-4-dehydrorhamnose 3,5-epimerase
VVLHDLREDSKTKGETNTFFMGEKNHLLLLIPPGVAHGYRVLGSEAACLIYHTTEAYDPQNPDEERIPYNDPDINYDWTTHAR